MSITYCANSLMFILTFLFVYSYGSGGDCPWKVMRLETKYELEKRAFIFACLCGLRVSDVRKLTWGDIKKVGDDYKIEIRQKKTRDRLSNPLSPEILHWLPERSDEVSSSDIVFPLVAEQYVNDKIREISKEAGIHKHLSFHSASHNKIFY